MFGEVVAHEHVEPFAVAPQVGIGQCDQLTVPCRGGVLRRPHEESGLPVDQGSGNKQGRRDRGGGPVEDLPPGKEIATDQAVEEGGVVVRHTNTVRRDADDALTLH